MWRDIRWRWAIVSGALAGLLVMAAPALAEGEATVTDPADAPPAIDISQLSTGIFGSSLFVNIQWTEARLGPPSGSELTLEVELANGATLTAVHSQDDGAARTTSSCSGDCADVRVPVRPEVIGDMYFVVFDFSDNPGLLSQPPTLNRVNLAGDGGTDDVNGLPVTVPETTDDFRGIESTQRPEPPALPPGPFSDEDGAVVQVADEEGDVPEAIDLTGIDFGFLDGRLLWVALFPEGFMPPDAFLFRASVAVRAGDTTVRAFSQVSAQDSPRASSGFECSGPACPGPLVPGRTSQGGSTPFVFIIDLGGIVNGDPVEILEVNTVVQETESATTASDSVSGPFEVDRTPRGFHAPGDVTTGQTDGTDSAPTTTGTQPVAEDGSGGSPPWLLLLVIAIALILAALPFRKYLSSRSAGAGAEEPEGPSTAEDRAVVTPGATMATGRSAKKSTGRSAKKATQRRSSVTDGEDPGDGGSAAAMATAPQRSKKATRKARKRAERRQRRRPPPRIVGDESGDAMPAEAVSDDPCAEQKRAWNEARARCDERTRQVEAAEAAADAARNELDARQAEYDDLGPSDEETFVELDGGTRITEHDMRLRRRYVGDAWERYAAGPSPEAAARMEEEWRRIDTPEHRAQRQAELEQLEQAVDEARTAVETAERDASDARARAGHACDEAEAARQRLDECLEDQRVAEERARKTEQEAAEAQARREAETAERRARESAEELEDSHQQQTAGAAKGGCDEGTRRWEVLSTSDRFVVPGSGRAVTITVNKIFHGRGSQGLGSLNEAWWYGNDQHAANDEFLELEEGDFAAAFQDVGELLEKSGEALRRTRDQVRVHVEVDARAVATTCQREVVCRNGEWVDSGNRRVRDSDAPMADAGGLTGDLVLTLGDADALSKVRQLMQSTQARLRELMDAERARANFATRCH